MASATIGAPGQLCSQLPPGFRFHPTDQELLTLYLKKKVTASLPPAFAIIAEIDLYKFNPWELPGKAFFGQGEWFFFSPRDRKYPNGVRPNRAAACGYWKATGTDKPVLAADGSGQCLGVKKALVFYKGRPPKGIKTNWVMHEYRLLDTSPPARAQRQKRSMRLDDWVLCRVRQKGSMSSGLENDGVTEFPSSPESLITNTDQKEAKQQVVEKSSSPAEDWSDQQLLGYLLGSFESTGENSDPGSAISFDAGGGSQSIECFAEMHHAEPPQFVSTVLSSIKRKLSFGMLDEMMLMQPGGKRQQCWVGEIASIDEFFI